ncbi:MAG: hypothetical protein JWM47_3745, partial [Acidimicrobiales bacterium]|nr:hypothetical protein [Acidimicrobiales bacterium]
RIAAQQAAPQPAAEVVETPEVTPAAETETETAPAPETEAAAPEAAGDTTQETTPDA